MGIRSEIIHEKLQVQVKDENVGGEEKNWDIKGRDLHQFVESISETCNVESKKKNSRGSTKNLRNRFLQGKLLMRGSSNDNFFQAAIQCHTDNLTEGETVKNSRNDCECWVLSDSFSQMHFSYVEATLREV